MVGKGKGGGRRDLVPYLPVTPTSVFALVFGEGGEKGGVAGGISWLTLCALRHGCEL